MKKALHTILKLLLVCTIFLGLQGKVIIRYLEFFHKNPESEILHSDVACVKNFIPCCKLQCFTRYFKLLNTPIAALLLIFIIDYLINDLLFFKEKLSIADSIRLLRLRAPPFI